MPSNERRVLIIEDNDALRVMLFTILRHQPLAVDTATNASDALEKIETCDYALILIDTGLSDDEAGLFLREFALRRPEAKTFIIVVRDPKDERPIDPIASAVLNKPLEIDTLSEVVRECAAVVPPSDNGLPCPPAESDMRDRMERSGTFYSN